MVASPRDPRVLMVRVSTLVTICVASALLALLTFSLDVRLRVGSGTGSTGGSSAGSGGVVAPAGGHAVLSLQSMIETYVAAPLPQRNDAISKQRPLIFYHQRKTSGQVMRQELSAAAAAHNLTSYLPFYGGEIMHATFRSSSNCYENSMFSQHVAVYGGHLVWGELPWWKAVGDGHIHDRFLPKEHASCVTIFREPVARMASQYYYRHIQKQRINKTSLYRAEKESKGKTFDPARYECLNNLTPAEIRSVMTDDGGSHLPTANEPFRMFSGLNNVQDIITLHPRRTPEMFAAVMQLTLHHLSHCVPIVLEDARSLALGRHFFPQMSAAFAERGRRNTGTFKPCNASQATLNVLRNMAEGEMLLYNAVQRKVQAMLAALKLDGAAGTAGTTEAAAKAGA